MAARLALIVVVAACASDPTIGPVTDSTCTTPKPTYASFGKAFFDTNCVPCHSMQNTGADRHGAPNTIDFDTESLIRDNTSDIDKMAAWGPTIHNSFMPPKGNPGAVVFPTDDERRTLGAYIACLVGR